MSLGAAEIARILHTPLRTIEHDLEEVRIWVRQETETENLRTLKQSVLTWGQMQKEMFTLYHRPTQPGETDLARKLGAMDYLIAINKQLDDLLLSPSAKELAEIRTEYLRVKSEYEYAKRNGLLSG